MATPEAKTEALAWKRLIERLNRYSSAEPPPWSRKRLLDTIRFWGDAKVRLEMRKALATYKQTLKRMP